MEHLHHAGLVGAVAFAGDLAFVAAEGLKKIGSEKEKEFVEYEKYQKNLAKEAAKDDPPEGVQLSEGTAKKVRQEVNVGRGEDKNYGEQSEPGDWNPYGSEHDHEGNKLIVNDNSDNNGAKVEGYNTGGTAGYLNSPLTSLSLIHISEPTRPY